jgi:hypothetical protein
MAMTAAVKDELSRVDVPKPCCRRAEMAALLRFAGGLHIVSGRVVVEAELDTGAVARRPGGCVKAVTTSSGSLRTARRWPARLACSTSAADRSAACPRTSSRRMSAVPWRPGAGRSWLTGP